MAGEKSGPCPVCGKKCDGYSCSHCGYEATRCPFCKAVVCHLEPDEEWQHIPSIGACGCMVACGRENVVEDDIEWLDDRFKAFSLKKVQDYYATCEPGEFEALSGGATIEDYANSAEALGRLLTETQWLKIVRFKSVPKMAAELQDFGIIMFFVHPQHRDQLQT